MEAFLINALIITVIVWAIFGVFLMGIIPPRYLYAISDDKLRPSNLNSLSAWHAPLHTLSKLGRVFRYISHLSSGTAVLVIVALLIVS